MRSNEALFALFRGMRGGVKAFSSWSNPKTPKMSTIINPSMIRPIKTSMEEDVKNIQRDFLSAWQKGTRYGHTKEPTGNHP